MDDNRDDETADEALARLEKLVQQSEDEDTKGYHAVYIFSETARRFDPPEQVFSPYFDLADAEKKREEVEIVCQRKSLRKKVTIESFPPKRTVYREPDEPFVE